MGIGKGGQVQQLPPEQIKTYEYIHSKYADKPRVWINYKTFGYADRQIAASHPLCAANGLITTTKNVITSGGTTMKGKKSCS